MRIKINREIIIINIHGTENKKPFTFTILKIKKIFKLYYDNRTSLPFYEYNFDFFFILCWQIKAKDYKELNLKKKRKQFYIHLQTNVIKSTHHLFRPFKLI